MIYIKLAVAAVLFSIAAYLAWRFYSFYMTTTGSTVERLAASFKKSATLAVQAVGGLILAVGNGVLNLSDFFNAPEVREFVTQHFTPEFATGAFVILIGVTSLARLRTMGSDTPKDKWDSPPDEGPH